MLIIVQLLLILFFLFALVKVIGRFKAGELSWGATVGWALFWVVATVVVLLPDSTAFFAKIVGIGRGTDLVVYIAVALLFFIIFRLTIKIELLNRDITKLTRKISLQEKDKK